MEDATVAIIRNGQLERWWWERTVIAGSGVGVGVGGGVGGVYRGIGSGRGSGGFSEKRAVKPMQSGDTWRMLVRRELPRSDRSASDSEYPVETVRL